MTSSTPNSQPQRHTPRWVTVVLKALTALLVALLGAVAAIAIAPLSPWFAHALSRWTYVEPTCADPQGLKMLDLREKGVATVKVSSGEVRPEDSPSDEPAYDGQTAMHAFDGRPGSGWVPTTLSPPGSDYELDALRSFDEDRITLDFTNSQPIALVCVINGSAANWVSYMRADRVRTVEVSLGNGEEELTRRTSLRTLPEHEIQNRQDLKLPNPAPVWKKPEYLWQEPTYDRLEIALPERWMGIGVDDPNTGPGRDTPTHLVMLAEVEIWVHTEQ